MRVCPYLRQANLIEQDDDMFEDLVQDLGAIYDDITLEKNSIERFVGYP
jgi:hypothetical protein